MQHLLEIRTYRLKPGTLVAFHEAMHNRAIPMIKSAGMDVVAYGKSDHEEETYFLIRAYESREALEAEQAAFYGSTPWQEGTRPALVDRIDTYVNTLIWASTQTVDDIRVNNPPLR